MTVVDFPAPMLTDAEREALPPCRLELQARAIEALRELGIDYHNAVRAINFGLHQAGVR